MAFNLLFRDGRQQGNTLYRAETESVTKCHPPARGLTLAMVCEMPPKGARESAAASFHVPTHPPCKPHTWQAGMAPNSGRPRFESRLLVYFWCHWKSCLPFPILSPFHGEGRIVGELLLKAAANISSRSQPGSLSNIISSGDLPLCVPITIRGLQRGPFIEQSP